MTTDTEAEALSSADLDALTQAVEQYCAVGLWQRQTVDALSARGDGWERVAKYCAYHMQMENLRLPPWQPAPCGIGPGNMDFALKETDPQRGYRAAALLRQRMERCGVSRWHPDPARACEAAEAELSSET